jgi:large subunit ribosomal protein L17
MRHRKAGYKLQRDSSARKALLRGLATSIILNDRIVTTVTKAKAVRPFVERMITLAKRDTLHSRRQAAAKLVSPGAVKKLFETLGPRFAERNGGYTRIMRLGFRKGDGAEQAMLELLGSELKKRAAERRKRREDRVKRQEEEQGQEESSSDEKEK